MVDKKSGDKGKELRFLWGRLLCALARLLTVLVTVGEALKYFDPTKGAGNSTKKTKKTGRTGQEVRLIELFQTKGSDCPVFTLACGFLICRAPRHSLFAA